MNWSRALVGATCLLLAALSAPGGAQAQSNQIAYASVTRAPVGSWADYVMSRDGEPQTVRVRYTLVQRDPKHVVLEMDSATPMGHMLMRLEFAPAGATRWKLGRARVKMGDNPARDVATDASLSGFGKDDAFGDKIAREAISVKAGTFDADHYRRKVDSWSTELWIDENVFPVGTVRIVDGQGSRFELVARGKDGKSAF